MAEGLNHWGFVTAAYAVTVGATLLLIAQSLRAMRRAETLRDASRSDRRDPR